MRLEREAPDPLYLQLKESLEAEIRAGHYRAHTRLPSERELSDQFQVSRMTARQALLELARNGVIYTRVGKGTFVAEPKIDQQLVALTGFTQDMRMRGGRPNSAVLESGVLPATSEQAAVLGLLPGARVIKLARLRLADDMPLAIETAYLPVDLCPGLLLHDFSVESLYQVLQSDYGLKLVSAEQTIEAALADPREAEALELALPAAVLRIKRLTYAASGAPVEYVLSVYRGDRYEFRSTLQARSAP